MTHEIEPNQELDDLGPAEDIPAEPLEGVEVGSEPLPEEFDYEISLDFNHLTEEFAADQGLLAQAGEKITEVLRPGRHRPYHIVVQMGHVARTRGATGTNGEQIFARNVAAHLAARLRDWYGHKVTVIGADQTIPKSDFFVAIHADGSTSSTARGASVGYRNADGQRFGAAWKKAYAALGWERFRGDNYTAGLRDYYGTRRAVAAGTKWAIIAEAGFLTNPHERAMLLSTQGYTRFAQAVCNAIGAMVGHPKDPNAPAPKPEPDPTRRFHMLTIFYVKRGTPDGLAAMAVTTMAPKGSVTNDVNEARAALNAGATVYAVGGPAANELPEAKAFRGATGLDTLIDFANFAKRGYK